MDALQDWATQLLGDPNALYTYTPYLRQGYGIISTAKSYLYPLIDQAARKPDLATIALLLVIIFVSLKLLDMLWQTVTFWFRLGRKLLLWGGLAALGLWMYSRGPEGVMEDVQYWMEVWSQEKDYWKEKERMARVSRQAGWSGGRQGGRGKTAGSWF